MDDVFESFHINKTDVKIRSREFTFRESFWIDFNCCERVIQELPKLVS